jgi:8-oxo-dGTP pyrophosphatase MutT (NUDIX family)
MGFMEEHLVVAAILRRSAQVLLCHRSPERRWFPDVWDFPGGHVRSGEEPLVALRRELLEELGVELDGVDGPPVLHMVAADASVDLTVWVVSSWRGTVTNRQLEEHDALDWFTRDELGALTMADPRYLPLLVELLSEPGAVGECECE